MPVGFDIEFNIRPDENFLHGNKIPSIAEKFSNCETHRSSS